MENYWASFRTNSDIACGGDPTLHTLRDASGDPVRLHGFRTPDTRTLEIDLLADATSEAEAAEVMDGWLDLYLRKAEWLSEIGVYNPDDEEADFREPADVFNRVGMEVRSTDD